MKKGKKMPSIELDGHSEARFVLVDGKIVRAESPPAATAASAAQPRVSFDLDRRLRE